MDYQILHDEIVNDPRILGYTGQSDQQIADLLNAQGQTRNREIVDTWEILEATVPADYSALSADEKQRYQTFVSIGKLNPWGANISAGFQAMFQGTDTLTNLMSLRAQIASRAEVLELGYVLLEDVAAAREMGGF